MKYVSYADEKIPSVNLVVTLFPSPPKSNRVSILWEVLISSVWTGTRFKDGHMISNSLRPNTS
jgi:hypothetical protein